MYFVDTAYIEAIKKKIFKNVRKNKTCILWTRSVAAGGYGRLYFNKKTVGIHRISYLLFKGPIPPKMLVCHTCDVRRCINPDHLFLGTTKDNAQDALKKGRLPRNCVKLNWKIVKYIRNKYKRGKYDYSALAYEYGVTKSTIGKIMRYKNWIPKDGVPKDLEPDFKCILSRFKAEEIRTQYKTGNYSHRILAKKYGVSKSSVGNIIRFKHYI